MKQHLSEQAQALLAKYKELHNQDRLNERDDWDTFFIKHALEASERSPDAETHVGAVLVRNNSIIAEGYNGFPANVIDRLLPNMRDEDGHKYDWMLHAEANCLFNAAREGISTKDSILYITHKPCSLCLLSLWQSGIREVAYIKGCVPIMQQNEKYNTFVEIFNLVTRDLMKFREVDLSGVLYNESE